MRLQSHLLVGIKKHGDIMWRNMQFSIQQLFFWLATALFIVRQIKGALATILTPKKYMLWKLVNSFKMMK